MPAKHFDKNENGYFIPSKPFFKPYFLHILSGCRILVSSTWQHIFNPTVEMNSLPLCLSWREEVSSMAKDLFLAKHGTMQFGGVHIKVDQMKLTPIKFLSLPKIKQNKHRWTIICHHLSLSGNAILRADLGILGKRNYKVAFDLPACHMFASCDIDWTWQKDHFNFQIRPVKFEVDASSFVIRVLSLQKYPWILEQQFLTTFIRHLFQHYTKSNLLTVLEDKKNMKSIVNDHSFRYLLDSNIYFPIKIST